MEINLLNLILFQIINKFPQNKNRIGQPDLSLSCSIKVGLKSFPIKYFRKALSLCGFGTYSSLIFSVSNISGIQFIPVLCRSAIFDRKKIEDPIFDPFQSLQIPKNNWDRDQIVDPIFWQGSGSFRSQSFYISITQAFQKKFVNFYS